jgi:DNA mismatch repair protein MutL
MGIIRLLDEKTASQIAAGEVVERPGSVAKELLENALDAGARHISVHAVDGGISRLVVRDDGCGMADEDAVLAFSRHATSKLASIDDLLRIGTFGFRGEALASIASVARVTLTTRTPDADVGFRVRVEGGHVVETGSVGAAHGTEIVVDDLFFNVPVRKKFLKTDRTEAAHVETAVLDAALARPDVGFSFDGAGRRALELQAADAMAPLDDKRRIERALSTLGSAVRDLLYPIDTESGGVRITGYVVAPLETRRDMSGVHLSVNGRPVSDRGLAMSVKVAFRTLLEVGRQPMCALDVQIDPALVDVNVHPRKAEVRFVEPRRVHGALIGMLSSFLATTPWLKRTGGAAATKSYALVRAPGVLHLEASEARASSGEAGPPARSDDAEARRARIEDAIRRFDARVSSRGASPTFFGGRGRVPSAAVDDAVRSDPVAGFGGAGSFSMLRVVGQIGLTFLVLEGEDGMVVIDQHAAHERVVFEKLRAEGRARAGRAQPLLFPTRVTLTRGELALLDTHRDALLAYGLDVEPFSDVDALVRAVPVTLMAASVDGLVRDALSALEETGHAITLDERLDAVCARLACHASIRRGQSLSEPEVRALLRSLDEIDLGAHCPHGRPVVRRVPFDELARWFDRH